MKQKKDPDLVEVRRLVTTLGPMVEDFEHRFDKERGTYIITFTMLSVHASEEAIVKDFELPLEQALWFFRGAVDAALWTANIMMAAARNGR